MWSKRMFGYVSVLFVGLSSQGWSQHGYPAPAGYMYPSSWTAPRTYGYAASGPNVLEGAPPVNRVQPTSLSPLVTFTAPVVPLPLSDAASRGVEQGHLQPSPMGPSELAYPRTIQSSWQAPPRLSTQPMTVPLVPGGVPGGVPSRGGVPYGGLPGYGPTMPPGQMVAGPGGPVPPWQPAPGGAYPGMPNTFGGGHAGHFLGNVAVGQPGRYPLQPPSPQPFVGSPYQTVTGPAEAIPTPAADSYRYGGPAGGSPSGAGFEATGPVTTYPGGPGSWNYPGQYGSSGLVVPGLDAAASGAAATSGMVGVEYAPQLGPAKAVGWMDWPSPYPGGLPGDVVGHHPWYASLRTLYMTRDDENPFYFSYDDDDRRRQLMPARSVNFDWVGGADVRIGRAFDCGTQAIEFGYWGLYPGQQELITRGCDCVGELMGTLNWEKLNYGEDDDGDPYKADYFVDHAKAHLLRRDAEAHNFELNWLQCLMPCKPSDPCHGPRMQHQWLLGVRYFKFHDNLLFGADCPDGNGYFRYEHDEIYYNIITNNHLIGPQVGGSGRFLIHPKWTLRYDLKFGMYANHIEHRSVIGGTRGIATINGGPNTGEGFCVHNSKNDVSFLGEIDLGFSRCITPRLTVTAGYRAVAIAGIAHPTDQIPRDLRMIQDVYHVDSNGSLILHGGYLGAEYYY